MLRKNLTPEAIRALRAEHPKPRARDFAEEQGIAEGQLVAADVGQPNGPVRIAAEPKRLLPLVTALGDVMALTRNESAVHEKRGVFGEYKGSDHVGLILGKEIDVRVFPSHWVSAYALEEPAEDGSMKRSIQIFDAAGDAVHKIHLKPESDAAAFAALVAELRLSEQSSALEVGPRKPEPGPKATAANLDAMRAEYDAMTDPHQFIMMVQKHGFNRLGAYRALGAPRCKLLAKDTVTTVLEAASQGGFPIMIFVGNMGMIQIHSGPVEKIMPMGPWINVMDPRFNLHLRADHVAEVWLVEKPTKIGPAVSIEAFDAQGALILQMFGRRDAEDTYAGVEQWNELVRGLPPVEMELA
jgi:putative hemin transport protein